MIKAGVILILCCTSVLLVSGCSGTRHSYESLLDSDSEKPVVVLTPGEKKEILAVGHGFPGYWGWYPAIVSHDPSVVSIECESGRSIIPFREPGMIFGGETCYIKARQTGITWLLKGNKYIIRDLINKIDLEKMTEDSPFPPTPEGAELMIKVKVIPGADSK